MLGQVLGDETALGQNKLLLLGRVDRIGEGNADEGCFPKGVNLFQLGGCKHVLVALEHVDIVREAELLEQPDKPLSAGVVEPDMSARDVDPAAGGVPLPIELDLGLGWAWRRHGGLIQERRWMSGF